MAEIKKPEASGKEEALKALLHMMADRPELVERFTITIRPQKILQGTDKKK